MACIDVCVIQLSLHSVNNRWQKSCAHMYTLLPKVCDIPCQAFLGVDGSVIDGSLLDSKSIVVVPGHAEQCCCHVMYMYTQTVA